MIEKAKKAKYTEHSVHAVPKDILAKYFKKKNIGYELDEDLQGRVDFQVVNVFDKIQMKNLGKFDVIFSRNMLLYCNNASREEVAMTFYDMLNPGGYVLLGQAEHMSHIVSVFKAKKIDNILTYQKNE